NDIKVEDDEMQQFAIEVARAQFAQYGMNNLTNDMLANYAQSMLQDEGTSRNMFDKIVENKVGDWLKEKIKLNMIEIQSKEFEEMLQKQNATEEAATEIADAISEEANTEE
ncbi:MAG: trigger factor, partial [Proteiniphilum sp.]|nr:trigger factor [Proteiniphilum sp.]